MESHRQTSNGGTSDPLSQQKSDGVGKGHDTSGTHSRPPIPEGVDSCPLSEKQPETRRPKSPDREERSTSEKSSTGKRSKSPKVHKDRKTHTPSGESGPGAPVPSETGPATASHDAAEDHTSLRDGRLTSGSQERAMKLATLKHHERELSDRPEAFQEQYQSQDNAKEDADFRSDTRVSFSQKATEGSPHAESEGAPVSQKQVEQPSGAAEAILSSTQPSLQAADPVPRNPQPRRPRTSEENAGSRPCSTESLEPVEASVQQPARGGRLAAVLPSTAREQVTSFLQTNPLVSLMRRGSRLTWTGSGGESRLSRSSRQPEDDECKRVCRRGKSSVSWGATTYDGVQTGGGTRRGAYIVVFLAAVLATAVLGTLFVLFASNKGRDRIPSAHSDDKRLRFQLRRLCSTQACLLAIDSLLDAMHDRDSHVCGEVSYHVCGGWRKDNRNHSSLEEQALERSFKHLHEAMMDTGDDNKRYAGTTQEADMAALYRSCVGFPKREHTAGAMDVLEALNISIDSVETLKTGRHLFQFVASTSLRTGFASVVSITLNVAQLVLDAGSSLELLLPRAIPAHFVEETLKELRVLGDQDVVQALLAIDGSVTSWLQQRSSTEPFVTRHLGSLHSPFDDATWVDVLSGLPANFPAFYAGTNIKIRAVPQIYGALSTLAATSVECARLYALLVFVAQVMRYHYVLTNDTAPDPLPGDYYKCLSVTGVQLPIVFLPWAYRNLVKAAAAVRLKCIVDDLKSSFFTEADADSIYIGNFSVGIIGETRMSDRNDTSMGSRNNKLREDGASFLANLVHIRADGLGQPRDMEGDVDRQLRSSLFLKTSTLGGHSSYAIILSATLLSEPSFVGDPCLPELDYASLGARIVDCWLDAEVRQNTALRAALENRTLQCPPSNVTSSADTADVAAEWALRTALLASRTSHEQQCQKENSSSLATPEGGEEEESNDDTRLLRDRVFFWRFCQSLCGDAKKARLCDSLLPRVPEFAKAFVCRPQQGARCGSKHRLL